MAGGGILKRLVSITRILVRKKPETINYEQLQTDLLEVETILNNRSLTYYYADENELCLMPNHVISGEALKLRGKL